MTPRAKKEFHLYNKPRMADDIPFLVTQCPCSAIEFSDKLGLELVIVDKKKEGGSLLNFLVDNT